MTFSKVSRRKFLQLSAGSLGAVGAASSPDSTSAERTDVSVVIDPGDRHASAPAVMWAVQELQSAFSARGLTLRRFDSIEQAPLDARCILAATPQVPAAMQALSLSAVPAPTGAESLAIIPASFGGRMGLLACGADSRGLTYALLELADRIRSESVAGRALSFGKPLIEQPHNALRSIGRLFVSDVEDKPWFNDREFWPPYLSMLAAQRFNRFQLGFGMGYDSLHDVRDAYLLFAYPFLLAVPGYRVRAVNLSDAERDQNLSMLEFIGRETVKRGIEFQLGLWTHGYQWIDSPHANYTIEGLTADNHAEYCRDALAALLRACPTVSGVTLRTHAESGVREGSYDFWRTVFSGVAQCGRKVEIDLHTKGLDGRLIDAALATGMPVRLSPKYWAEHIGMPYQQAAIRELEMPREQQHSDAFAALSTGSRSFTRYGYADFLREDRRYRVMYRVFPGSHRLLLSGDPTTAASHARAFGFCGADGAEFFEPLSFKGRRGSGIAGGGRCAYADRSLEPRWDWEKYLYTYRIWGRLLYDPATRAEVWRRFLRHRFGRSASHIEAALANSTRILPIVTTAHLPSAANDTYMPEIYTNQPIADPALPHPYGDTPAPKVFGRVSPLDPQFFLSIEELVGEIVQRKRTGKYSPSEVARWLDRLASAAERHMDQALKDAPQPGAQPRGEDPELRRVDLDVRIQVGLARFFAAKLRSAALYSLHGRTSSLAALEEAVREYRRARMTWAQFAEQARGLYVADITIGPLPHQRGHWLDRLPAMDADIGAMSEQLASARARSAQAVSDPLALHELLSDARDASIAVRHRPPENFVPAEPLALSAVIDPSSVLTSARLLYRHVNQAEEYQVVDLIENEGEYRAVIPAAYTASSYPLQYFFELIYGESRARRYPGFASELGNQPYFVVRPVRPRTS